MALSEAQRKANDKYIREHYRQVKLSMPKEEVNALEAHCKAFGYTKAGFIRQAIRDKMEQDRNDTISECGGIRPVETLPSSYYAGQAAIDPQLDENGDIIPE